MERSEAEGKLFHYANTYGEAIYKLTPEQALELAVGYREQARTQDPVDLSLLATSVHYEAISECLKVLQNTPRQV